MIHEGIRDYWVSYLKRQPHHVYAVLDAAHGAEVLKLAHGLLHESLFDDLADVAPYLVVVPTAQLERVIGKAWGRSCAVFFTSSYPITALRSHLRRVMDAEVEGDHYLFRFYDPRVLRAIAAVSTQDEIDELLGPIERFVVEGRVATYATEIARAGVHHVGVAA